MGAFQPGPTDVHRAAVLKTITGIPIEMSDHREELNVERLLYVREEKELRRMAFIRRCLPCTNPYVNPWFRLVARGDLPHS